MGVGVSSSIDTMFLALAERSKLTCKSWYSDTFLLQSSRSSASFSVVARSAPKRLYSETSSDILDMSFDASSLEISESISLARDLATSSSKPLLRSNASSQTGLPDKNSASGAKSSHIEIIFPLSEPSKAARSALSFLSDRSLRSLSYSERASAS